MVRTSAILRGHKKVGYSRASDHIVRVFVLRAAVTTMGFKLVSITAAFTVTYSDKY